MIEISDYRYRIGTFSQKYKVRKISEKTSGCHNPNSSKKKLNLQNVLQIFVRIALFLSVLHRLSLEIRPSSIYPSKNVYTGVYYTTGVYSSHPGSLIGFQMELQENLEFRRCSKNMSVNFQARYKFGNQSQKIKGVRNLQVNIRSLRNKIPEIKNIVRQYNPHILGISESELKKVNNQYDERQLKVPGYDLLFPLSWSKHGYARVVVYVKSTLQYQQVLDLGDDVVQSVWLKGGFRNSKKIFFCHAYREHSSSLGSSIQSQRDYLDRFLTQWEKAIVHGDPGEANEVHVAGDMNVDILDGKWLRPDYHLITLSRMIQSICNAANFSQLVSKPTRSQFNSTSGVTDISCIDHIYTNFKFRCSAVSVTSFGASDHDIIGYTRYSRDPPSPAKVVRKRSYKEFIQEDFLSDLREVDWSEVYLCKDVDEATDTLTNKFKFVIDQHAPWVIFQQRKKYAPWLTNQTIQLMKTRDDLKKAAVDLTKEGKDASETWARFK